MGTITLKIKECILLPSIFLTGRGEVVLGASDGQVRIVSLPTLATAQVLDHGGSGLLSMTTSYTI
jgi:hypothetical protein